MEQPKFVEHPDPNVVLRGGPLDGCRTRVHNWSPASLEVGGQMYTYRPLGELDTEYPTLNVYVFDEASR
jgi:uncharacterized Fe-S cluster-containing protein